MNSAGYRFAASDQAYYIPSIVHYLDPSAFPRDAALIDAQARLTLFDEVFGTVVRLTGVSLQRLFLALYVITLVAIAAGAVRLASHFSQHTWTLVAVAAAMTLRHAIAKTGANTLEGYFHPRVAAFALGLFAVSGFLERRNWVPAVLLLSAAAIHPTTACWFACWLIAAGGIGRLRRRGLTIAATVLAVVAIGLLAGPLRGRLIRMDDAWLAAIGEKDLYPLVWPINVWITNLIALPIIACVWHARRRLGALVRGETALVAGAFVLFALFLGWLPFNVARVAIAVQLQLSRVFWIIDVFGTIYLVCFLGDRLAATRPWAIAALLIALSLTRGLYSTYIQFRDRPLFAVDLQHGDWRDAMAFARTTEPGSGWLADPIHAARYGSSVRAAADRDVLLERLKDHALAIYDRDVAMKVADKERALDALAWNTPGGARALARRYGLDYLIVDRELDLPLVHRSGSLFIYRVR